MAGRHDKFNADYFSHDNGMRNDKKLKAVRAKFGITGYAVYNMLLEALSESDMIMIRNSEMEIEMLAGDFGVISGELIELLEYFCKINLIKMDKNFITCPQLERRLAPIFEKRKKTLDELRSNYCKINGISNAEIPISGELIELPSRDSKVKESKVKEERNIKERKPDFFSETYQKRKLQVREVIADLNAKAGKNFSDDPHIYSGTQLIFDRLGEGKTAEQCKLVIAKKIKDPKFERRYLCPDTLFKQPNFDRYLNEDERDYDGKTEAPEPIRKSETSPFEKEQAEYRRELEGVNSELTAAFHEKISALKEELNEHSYHAFIEGLLVVESDRDRIVLFHEQARWLINHYSDRIKKAVGKKVVFVDANKNT